jgi:tRNA dimethylallyltransferase
VSEGRVVAVVGPTATGKSDLAVALARQLDGEIVNADSMQLYAGMDIGTAKLPPAERGGIEHHLLDIWPLAKSAAVAEYQAIARLAIAAIHDRGRLPIVVGGSGLYLRGALDKLEFPGESREIRERLYAELAVAGPAPLHERLAVLDPLAAAAVLPTNGRRIVRALEVIELTGAPFTARMPGFDSIYDLTQIGLDRDDLDDRVALRVDRMMTLGLLEEVRALLPAGLRASPTAGKALGYAQLLAVLDDAGTVTGDLADAVDQTVRATRRFARRQRSWFRRDPRISWLDGADPDLVGRALTTLG